MIINYDYFPGSLLFLSYQDEDQLRMLSALANQLVYVHF